MADHESKRNPGDNTKVDRVPSTQEEHRAAKHGHIDRGTPESRRDEARSNAADKNFEGRHDTSGSGPVTMTGDKETPLPEGAPESAHSFDNQPKPLEGQ